MEAISKTGTSTRVITYNYIRQGQWLGLAHKMILKLWLKIWQDPGLEIQQHVKVIFRIGTGTIWALPVHTSSF